MTLEKAQIDEEGAAGFDRRSRRRYPLHLTLTGRSLGKRPISIVGVTVNMSSQGVLFAVSEAVPAHARIELQIDWPVRSGKGAAQQLSVLATVVRSAKNLVAGRIWRHDLGATSSANSSQRPDLSALVTGPTTSGTEEGGQY